MKKIIEFLVESYAEFKKVNWPTRDDVVVQTFVVIVSVVIVAIILFFMDLGVFNLISKIIRLGR